ncbi:MFS transporter [Streptomyces sp. A0642]|uniref:MFS transporter n=1 Tax=Streptomyces sp. A0642 TaxID=2563100 RepID=UPI0010A26A5A|nr:MFS transporter [Streptomyces sp. A0642]THA75651.1 MFS transporter [Streptomyces sp. A0642]
MTANAGSPDGRRESPAQVPRGRALVAVAGLSLALFTFATVEALPVGLLPQIAHGLGVSLPSVGLLVTGYGLVVMATAIPLTALTRRIPRRRLLAVVLALFTGATLLCGMAPGYGVLLGARVLIALTHAVMWSVVASAATGMFPERVRAKVVAALFGGSSLAQVLGAPAGTWLGQQTDWRVPFVVVSCLGLLSGITVVGMLPSSPVEANPAATAPQPDRFRFLLVVTATAVVIGGFFTFYTYVTVFLTDVAGISPHSIGAVFAVGGVGGLIGTSVSGLLSGRSARGTMIGSVALVTAALALLVAAGDRPVVPVAAITLLLLSLSAMVTALTSRILHIAPGNVDVASAASSAAFQAGIAAGSFLGGTVLAARGPDGVAVLGMSGAAAGLALLLAEEPLSRLVGRFGEGEVRTGFSPPGPPMAREESLSCTKGHGGEHA